MMEINEAIERCHIRSAIYREIKPEIKYWKNHFIPIIERIPREDVSAKDWEEYDPRDNDDCSLFMFND